MKTLITSLTTVWVLTLNLTLFSQAAFADSSNEFVSSSKAEAKTHEHTAYVSMNVGVEINGLETAALQAAEGLELIGESLRNIADHPELSPERQKQIEHSLSRVNQLSQSLTATIEQLPTTVEKSIAPVVKVSNQLSAKIRQIIIIASITLILIILIALVAVYHFVLVPSTQAVIKTTKLLGELAEALETTANTVDITSKRNLQIMENFQKVPIQTKPQA